MKLRNLFFVSLAVCTFAACSNDDEPQTPEAKGTPAALSVKVGSLVTKAYSDTQTDAEKTMKNIEVTVKGSGVELVGKIEDGERVGEATVNFAKGEGLVVNGQYNVIVRVKGTGKATSYPSVNLQEESAGNFAMYGASSTTLAQADGNEITVGVNRTVARVDFETLTVACKDATTGLIDTKIESFTVSDVYLENVAETADAQTINANTPSSFLSGDGNAAYAPLRSTSIPADEIMQESSATDLGMFYILPNTSDTKTYLVIKGTLNYADGTALGNRVYRVAIDGALAQTPGTSGVVGNTIYNISATIVGRGEAIPADLSVTITCNNWNSVNLTPDLD